MGTLISDGVELALKALSTVVDRAAYGVGKLLDSGRSAGARSMPRWESDHDR